MEEERKRLHLQESESVVAHIASRVFSAYVAADQVHERNEEHMIEKSIKVAIKMAKKTDSLVMDDAELPKQNDRLAF